tara:strand:+ start:203 stop:523 length:321 start_codon:yes stop_codon:yes gene_type:complete
MRRFISIYTSGQKILFIIHLLNIPVESTQCATANSIQEVARGFINIVNGVSIHERSKNIDNRKLFGYWEGDLGSGSSNTHIATLVDRKSRYTIILKLAGKDASRIS